MGRFKIYTTEDLEEIKAKGREELKTGDFNGGGEPVPNAPMDKLIKQHRSRLSGPLRAQLKRRAAPSDRSEAMHGLAKDLLRAGVPPINVASFLKALEWNKFRDRRGEDEHLWREVSKASAALESEGEVVKNGHRVVKRPPIIGKKTQDQSLRDALISTRQLLIKRVEPPSWLVEGIWTSGTVGFIAGLAKTYKSTFATDLGLSVATGEPFLGHFPVLEQGPVIMIQEENDEGLQQDRVRRMMVAKSQELPSFSLENNVLRSTGDEVPFYFVNNFGFVLEDQDMVDQLEELIAEIRPVLVILDPLYLMAGGDVSSSTDMTEVVRWLVRLKSTYGCSVIFVHHFKKPGENSAGQPPMTRMFGSSMLANGFDCALMMEPSGTSIKCYRDFRHWRRQPFMFDMFMTEGDVDYEVKVSETGKSEKSHPLMDLVLEHQNQGLTVAKAAKLLKVSSQAVHQMADKLPIRKVKRPNPKGTGRAISVMFPETNGDASQRVSKAG